MPRLLDDIRRIGRLDAPWFVENSKRGSWLDYAKRLGEILKDPEIPVVLADNVAQYYWESSGQEYWDLKEHFPNIAPPYHVAWFEFRFPKKIHSDEKGDLDVEAISSSGRAGWLVFGADRKDVKGEDIPDNTRWLLCLEGFLDYGLSKDSIQGPIGTITLAVDAEGRLIDRPFMQTFSHPMHNEVMRAHIGWIHPVLLTICFMHCKNVRVEENVVPDKLAKKYRKHHGISPTNYKTLLIEPMKEILRKEGRSGEQGVPKALHICRGHFKDYREGKGLFGKYHMLVWHDAVVRGTRGSKAPAREIEVKV